MLISTFEENENNCDAIDAIEPDTILSYLLICKLKTFENEWRGRGYVSIEAEDGRRVEEELFQEENEEEDVATISTLVKCLGNDIITCKRKFFGLKSTDGIIVNLYGEPDQLSEVENKARNKALFDVTCRGKYSFKIGVDATSVFLHFPYLPRNIVHSDACKENKRLHSARERVVDMIGSGYAQSCLLAILQPTSNSSGDVESSLLSIEKVTWKCLAISALECNQEAKISDADTADVMVKYLNCVCESGRALQNIPRLLPVKLALEMSGMLCAHVETETSIPTSTGAFAHVQMSDSANVPLMQTTKPRTVVDVMHDLFEWAKK